VTPAKGTDDEHYVAGVIQTTDGSESGV